MTVSIESEAASIESLATSTPYHGSLIHACDGLASRKDVAASVRNTATINIYKVADAVFDADSTLLFTRNGVVRESTYLVEMDRFKNTEIRPSTCIDLSETAEIGIGFNRGYRNYYHWMVQCLSAIFSYTRLPGNSRARIILPPLAGFQERSLELARLDIDILTTEQARQYKCHRINFSSYLHGAMDYSPSPLAAMLFDKIKAEVAVNIDTKLEERLYISRIDSHNRKMMNEEEVIALMQRMGFYVVSLSNEPIDRQIRLFSNAKIIVAPHGAGMTNILFCRPDCKIYELTPEHYVNPCFINLAHTKRLGYWIDTFQSLNEGERHSRGWLADLSVIGRRIQEIESSP
jgi:hypothetical protein